MEILHKILVGWLTIYPTKSDKMGTVALHEVTEVRERERGAGHNVSLLGRKL
jgi:hypothetical protein